MSTIPGFDPVPLDSYEPLLLTTKEQFDVYWPRASKLVEKCVKRSMYGEMNAEDIKNMALQQRAFVFVFRNDRGIQPDVKLVLIFEVCGYPKLPALNVLVVAGSDLDYFYDKFWTRICGWAYMNGVRSIESWVSPAMERVLNRYKFKPTYKVMRLDLTEA